MGGGTMNRRHFLKLTGIVAATAALASVPATSASAEALDTDQAGAVRDLVAAPRLTVTRLAMRGPGDYRVTGLVRLESPIVEISGIANSQQMSWSGAGSQVVPFTSFETYDGIGLAPEITVRGGRLESLSVTPILFG